MRYDVRARRGESRPWPRPVGGGLEGEPSLFESSTGRNDVGWALFL